MKRIVTLICALAAMFAAALAAAAPAAAQYPVDTSDATLLSGTPAPGETITFAGCCFTPGATVDVAAEGSYEVLFTVEADGAGYVEAEVDIPEWAKRLILVGPSPDGGTLRLVLDLMDSDVLPVTGGSVASKAMIATVGVLALVGGLLVATRKRAKTA